MCNLPHSTQPIPCTAIDMKQNSPTSKSDKPCAAEDFDGIDSSVCGTIPFCMTRGAWSPPQGKPRLGFSYISEGRLVLPLNFNHLEIQSPKGLPALPFSASLAHPSPTALNNNLE